MEINETENRQKVETNHWDQKQTIWKEINKTEKSLARPIKEEKKEREREKTQFTSMRNEWGDNHSDSRDIRKLVREYYEWLYANVLDHWDETDRAREAYITQPNNNKNLRRGAWVA